jgi:hypothetical protein
MGNPIGCSISFGALSERIEEQLQQQGFRLAMGPMERHYLQRDADEVSRLLVRGVITEADAQRARKRLMSEIGKHARFTGPAQQQETES